LVPPQHINEMFAVVPRYVTRNVYTLNILCVVTREFDIVKIVNYLTSRNGTSCVDVLDFWRDKELLGLFPSLFQLAHLHLSSSATRDVNETLGSETETRPRRLVFSPRRDRDLQVVGPRQDRDRNVEKPRPRRFSRRWHFGLPK